jgi:hypothetical protein
VEALITSSQKSLLVAPPTTPLIGPLRRVSNCSLHEQGIEATGHAVVIAEVAPKRGQVVGSARHRQQLAAPHWSCTVRGPTFIAVHTTPIQVAPRTALPAVLGPVWALKRRR